MALCRRGASITWYRGIVPHPCDVRSPESEAKPTLRAVASAFGQVDVLVNNAGIGFVMKDTREVSPEEWQLVIDVTLSGVFLCTQTAASYMEKERVQVVGLSAIIASQAAKSGFRIWPPTAQPKHGVIGLTRTAAIDYGSAGITVNAVCPNHVTTGLGSAQENAYFSAFKAADGKRLSGRDGCKNPTAAHWASC